MLVEQVNIDGHSVRLWTSRPEFQGFFAIDSITLLLGSNGSGKTHLMLEMAELLTQGGDGIEGRSWVQRRTRELPSELEYGQPPTELGVIYYTPLPFRREARPHGRFVDASRMSKTSLDERLLRYFPRVAASLGLSTRLIANVSYRKSIIRLWIAPLLINSECRISDPALDEFRSKLSRRRSSGLAIHSKELSRFSLELMRWIRSSLRRHGKLECIVLLSTLECLATPSRSRRAMLVILLEHLDLAIFNEESGAEGEVQRNEVIGRFTAMALKVMDIISSLPKSSVSMKSPAKFEALEFAVESEVILKSIGPESSVIRLVWENLSSGLISLVDQFARLDAAMEKLARKKLSSIIVMVDEGDSFLHLEWQREYIQRLNDFLGDAKDRYGLESLQAVVATHSPIISGDFPAAMIRRLGDKLEQETQTFGGSLDSLVIEAFQTPSIGLFASQKIKGLHKKVAANTADVNDMAIIDMIGDPGLRRAVLAVREDRS